MSAGKGKGRHRRKLILLTICVFIFLANCIQFQLSAYSFAVIPQFDLNAGEFSQLLMAPMLTAVVVSIPLGALADRFGPKIIITVANLLALVGAILRLTAGDYPAMFAAMVLLGFSPASINACLTKILGAWFGSKIDRAMGAFYASSSLGIVGALVAVSAGQSPESVLISAVAAMAICTVLWMLFAQDNPLNERPGKPEPVLEYLNIAGRNKVIWLVALTLGFGLAASTAYSGFLPQYLEASGSARLGESGLITAMITLGSMAGSATSPFICARLGVFKPFLLVATLLGALLMAMGWQASHALIWPVMLLTGFFCAAPAPILQSFPYLLPRIREKYAGSAGGLIATISMLMAYLLPTACAYALEGDLRIFFVALGGLFALSLVCIAFMPELGRVKNSALSSMRR